MPTKIITIEVLPGETPQEFAERRPDAVIRVRPNGDLVMRGGWTVVRALPEVTHGPRKGMLLL